ncbi:MAG: YfhO family protein [Chloroherpetonaceae bacterium]|nr:YfhO family protein [Chthonomonadaceae bacterium]MDW8208292.1 YfhO family protein [Chloroherpetonaceae bacterium]
MRPAYPWLFLGGFCVALLWPLCIGRTLYWGDILLYFAPMYDYLAESLRQRVVPLWNPHVLCGQPFVGNPQMSVFYPATLALIWLDTWNYTGLTSLVHLWLAGALAYIYLRRWTAEAFAALAGACVYMGNAFLLGKLQFPPMLQSAAWLPGLLWSADRVLDAPGAHSSLLLAACVGMVLLAGHAQIAYIALLCMLGYVVMRLCNARQSQREAGAFFWRRARYLAVALVLGGGLSAVHVLPALQLTMTSSRLHLNPWDTNRFTLEPKHLLTLILPSFLGHPASGDYWGGETPWEPALFAGWLPLLLAALVVRRRWPDCTVRFWTCMALLGIWLAFGVWGGLYLGAYYLLPGLANFHDPARFLLWTVWALSVLTALGLSGLRATTPVRAGILAGVIVPLWFYGLQWNPFASGADLRTVVRRVVSDGRAPALSGTNLRIYYPAHKVYWNRHVTDGYSDYGNASEPGLRLWVSTLLPNLPLFGREKITAGYEPVPVAAVTDVDAGARTTWRRNDPVFLHYMRVVQAGLIRLPVGCAGARPYATTVERRSGEGIVSLKVVPAPPSVWVTRRAQYTAGTKRTLAAMSNPGFDPTQVALIDRGDVAAIIPERFHTDVPAASVMLQKATRHAFHARVDAGDAPAFLTVASTAYPGWWARVDTRLQRPLRAYGAFLGVPLPPGTHQVRVEYRPFVYRLGLYLSLTTLSAMTAIRVCCSVRSRRFRTAVHR